MEYNILVIDDEWSDPGDPRGDVYKKLEVSLGSGESQWSLKIHEATIDNLEERLSEVDTKYYDMVILDVILDNWRIDPNITFHRILEDQRLSECPIALVSKNFDARAWNMLRNHWKMDNLVYFMRFDELQNSTDPLLISKVLVELINKNEPLAECKVSDDERIRILHLSDLHFGGKHIKYSPEALVQHLADTFPSKDNRPHLILVTGDIVHKGMPKEYDVALKWFEELLGEQGLNIGGLRNNRVMIVPGNHDINISLAAAAKLKIKYESKKTCGIEVKSKIEPSLNDYAFSPFKKFAYELTGQIEWLSKSRYLWIDKRFKKYGLIFYGLNSSSGASIDCVKKYEIPRNVLHELNNEIRSTIRGKSDNDICVVGMMHFPPITMAEIDGLDRSEVFKQAVLSRDTTPSHLICFGDSHRENIGVPPLALQQVLCIGSGSPLLKLNGEKQRGYNIIDLKRKKNKIIGSCVTTYLRSGDNFVPSKKSFTRSSEGYFKHGE